jgi:hypothetical protein
MKLWIAERELMFSLKGSDELSPLVIRIGKPYYLKEGMVSFAFAPGTAGCSVEFDGLNNDGYLNEVYGADLLQALQLAVDIEPTLKRLSKTYDFYFPNGEPYFDSERNT